jgi:hypothetical protein
VTYQVVFDAAAQGYDPSFASFGLVLLAIGVCSSFGARRGIPRGTALKGQRIFPGLFIGFALLWTTVAFLGTYLEHADAVRALETGQTTLVEGPVEHLCPATRRDCRGESFDVRGVHFQCSDHRITSGFRRTSATGGPIREGLRVRIHHAHGLILRLEIPEGIDVPPSAAPTWPPWYALAAFPLLMPLVAFPIALLGGWRGLAERFAAPELPAGEAFSGQSVSLGLLGNYNNCINMTVGPDSIGLVPPHPIESVREETGFLRRAVYVTLRDGAGTLRLRGAAGKAVKGAWDRQGWHKPG